MAEKKSKIKEWAADHPTTIGLLIPVTVAVATVGGFVALVIYSEKDQKKAIESYTAWVTDMNQWLNDQVKEGNYVYRLYDGTYLTVPTEAKQEVFLK